MSTRARLARESSPARTPALPVGLAAADVEASTTVRPSERIVESLAIPPRVRAASQAEPLPLPVLEPLVDDTAAEFAVVRVDASGAVASRGALGLLRWAVAMPIRYEVRCGLIVVTADADATRRVPVKRNLVLPSAVRAQCRIVAGDQVLLAALLEHDMLVIYPQRRLYDMVIAYHASLRPRAADAR